MSKIEEALEKARSKESSQHPNAVSEPGTQLRTVSSRDESDFEAHIAASKQIARMNEPWQHSRKELAEIGIIYPGMEDSRTANAFRELRTKILQTTRGKNCSILVTSTSRSSGSSFVAKNLAVAFSFDESMTALLMDCNLANPSHDELLSPDATLGLTDYLRSDDMSVEQIIHPVGIQRLRVIPTGGQMDITVEYFTSLKMRRLLRSIKERFADRYIIIDAPPIMESADTRILADVCDYAVLVVPYARATEAQVLKASKSIGAQKLIGVVFNDEPRVPTLPWMKKIQGGMNQVAAKRNNHGKAAQGK
ncbi:MAG: CpsD/CapB family tyrosine-protein kinase [Dehalococcoidales bacterium]|nr:CpsD/CapB family tyrosine-protein kinase [Dehalococcoidales bacterium]